MSGFFRRSSRPKNVAGVAGSSDEAQTAYERRRQQVRRAQRNHRERKTNYIKALEQEVVNLRRQNQQNIITLESEISLLHQYLLSCGMDPPARQARVINTSDDPVDVGPSSYTVGMVNSYGSVGRLHVDMPELQSEGHLHDSGFSGIDVQGHNGASSSASDSLSPPHTQDSSKHGAAVAQPGSLGSVDKTMGVDFVLALEHPCMQHTDMTRDSFGTHSHMPSHTLLQYAPADISGPTTWEVAGADIRRLLNLSNTFQLEGEITPVQAWYRLKQHPRFGQLQPEHINRLKRMLATSVKCYGFGSVMEESDWNIAVEEIVTRL